MSACSQPQLSGEALSPAAQRPVIGLLETDSAPLSSLEVPFSRQLLREFSLRVV